MFEGVPSSPSGYTLELQISAATGAPAITAGTTYPVGSDGSSDQAVLTVTSTGSIDGGTYWLYATAGSVTVNSIPQTPPGTASVTIASGTQLTGQVIVGTSVTPVSGTLGGTITASVY